MDQNSELDNILNDLDFKPITEGLGFHHSLKEQKQVKTDLKSQSENLKRDLDARVKQMQSQSIQSEKPVQMGELAAFYETEKQGISKDLNDLISVEAETSEVADVTETLYMARMIAWFIDITIISSVMLLMATAIYISSGISISLSEIANSREELALSAGVLFSLFYVFYFTVLDMTKFSTLGKRTMGLTVISSSKRVNLLQSTIRSILTLAGIPFFGMLSILRLVDTASKTRIIKR